MSLLPPRQGVNVARVRFRHRRNLLEVKRQILQRIRRIRFHEWPVYRRQRPSDWLVAFQVLLRALPIGHWHFKVEITFVMLERPSGYSWIVGRRGISVFIRFAGNTGGTSNFNSIPESSHKSALAFSLWRFEGIFRDHWFVYDRYTFVDALVFSRFTEDSGRETLIEVIVVSFSKVSGAGTSCADRIGFRMLSWIRYVAYPADVVRAVLITVARSTIL